MVFKPCADVDAMNAAESRRSAEAARDTGLLERVDGIVDGHVALTQGGTECGVRDA